MCSYVNPYFSLKKNSERFGRFLAQKIHFECPIVALFNKATNVGKATGHELPKMLLPNLMKNNKKYSLFVTFVQPEKFPFRIRYSTTVSYLMTKSTNAFQEEEEPCGFNKVKHLKNDQKHLRLLIGEMDPNKGRKSKVIKSVLQDALQFVESRERFWASQQYFNRCQKFVKQELGNSLLNPVNYSIIVK